LVVGIRLELFMLSWRHVSERSEPMDLN